MVILIAGVGENSLLSWRAVFSKTLIAPSDTLTQHTLSHTHQMREARAARAGEVRGGRGARARAAFESEAWGVRGLDGVENTVS